MKRAASGLEAAQEIPGNLETKEVKQGSQARHWWLTPAILATWEAEMGKIVIPGQANQKVSKIPSQPTAGCSGTCLLP
jgi:hypothetical protein